MSASSLANTEDHDHAGKCRSISEIQKEYCYRLSNYFLKITDLIETDNIAKCMSLIEELENWLPAFWIKYVLCMQDQLNESDSLKAVCGIDSVTAALRSSTEDKIVSSVGLYIDTTVLTDPVMVHFHLANSEAFSAFTVEQRLALLCDSIAAVLRYKEAIFADLTPPICVFMPELFTEPTIMPSIIESQTLKDTTHLFSILTGKSLDSFERLKLLLLRINSTQELDKRIKNRGLWREAIDLAGNLPSDSFLRWDKIIIDTIGDDHSWNNLNVGQKTAHHFTGKYTVINELLLRSWTLEANPLFTSLEHWNLFVIKEKFDVEHQYMPFKVPAIARALLSPHTKQLQLLTNLSITELIELRKEGALHELRQNLFGNLKLPQAGPGNTEQIEKGITENIESLLRDHEQKLEQIGLQNKQFFGKSVAPLIANTAFAVCGVLSEDPLLKALAAGFGLSGLGSSAKNLKDDWRKLRHANGLAKTSSSALLINRLKQTGKP